MSDQHQKLFPVAVICSLFLPILLELIGFRRIVAAFSELSKQENAEPRDVALHIAASYKTFAIALVAAIAACALTVCYAKTTKKKIGRWVFWLAGVASAGWAAIAVFWIAGFQSEHGGIYLGLLIVIWWALISANRAHHA